MTAEGIERFIQNGEGLEVEFKESLFELSKTTFQTICAFLNRQGGHLLLGVKNDGTVEGVLESEAERMKNEIVTNANNLLKLNPQFYLSPEIINYKGKAVIYVYVPQSSQVHSTAGRIFDRNATDGDIDITNIQHQVTQLYVRKQQTYSENKIYPAMRINDFRKDLLQRVRTMAANQRANHPWMNMNDEELLQSAGLYQKNYSTGEEGYTLAAALLLGTDEIIQSILPHYKTDAILRIVNVDRYDDREDVRTNLIESYDRLIAFIAKHLPDKFYQEGTQRISLRDRIFREVIANLLVHREFTNAFPAKMIIEKDGVTTENWNRPHGSGLINPALFSPFPKNPLIAKFFKEIGWVEELGSGVRNAFQFVPSYSAGKKPVFEEGDVFRCIIPLDGGSVRSIDRTEGVKMNVDGLFEGITEGIKERLIEIVELVRRFPGIKMSAILKNFDRSERTIRSDVKLLIDKKVITYRGSFKTGGYYLNENLAEQTAE
ncbi:MAG: RNA-binding domain-containing protein [Flavisolibacter sp.]